MTIETILNLRYQWESMVSFRKSYDLPSYDGNIHNLKDFIKNGHKSNRFRKNFDEAMRLAREIVEYYERPMASLDKQLA
jgi:hypothetical protein